jgi:hypothetical protein
LSSYVQYIQQHCLNKKKIFYSHWLKTLVGKLASSVLRLLIIVLANDEASHVPTATQVNRVFGTAEESGSEEEQLEEIDFSEVGRLQAEVDAAAANITEKKTEVTVVEEKFTGFYIDTNPAPVRTASTRDTTTTLGEEEDDVIVYVAPHPRAGPVTPPAEPQDNEVPPSVSIITGLAPTSSAAEMFSSAGTGHESAIDIDVPEALPEVSQSEVPGGGVAEEQQTGEPLSVPANISEHTQAELPPVSATEPVEPSTAAESQNSVNTSTGQEAPAAQLVAVEDITFSFTETTQKKTITRRLHPVRTPRSLLKKNRGRRKPLRGFSSFGASLAEAQLRRDDPRVNERRMGDSDLDWGDESDVEELSAGIADMAVDEGLDVNAMISFVKSMSAEGSRTVTMDDVADAERIRQEDEEDGGEGEESALSEGESSEEDSELEEVMRQEEELLIAEGVKMAGEDDENDDEEEESSDDEDIDGSPGRSFQARLQRVRERAKSKGKAQSSGPMESDEELDDSDTMMEQSWADDDEKYIAYIQV